MRFLFVCRYYPPEELSMAFLVREFAHAVVAKGHEAHVLTGLPNWPSGRIFPGYHPRRAVTEDDGGVTVHRVPFLPSPNGSFAARALDIASFRWAAVWHGRRLPRPDLVFAPVPPNDDALAAASLADRFECPLTVNVQDLQPDCAEALGYVRNPFLLRYLRRQERVMYSRSSLIVAIGEGVRDRLLVKGLPPGKVVVLPNWIDAKVVFPMPRENALRAEWGIPASDFVVLYAGTFGRIHDVPMILDAADRLRDMPGIRFVLVGQGHDFEKVRSRVAADPEGRVVVRPLVPRSRLPELQSLADVSVVTMKPGFGAYSVPSKALGYMSAGRGVLASVDGDCDTARLVRAAGCGDVLPPGDFGVLADRIRRLVESPEEARLWGERARRYVLERLDATVLLDRGVAILENAARGGRRA